jgi:hypothetical protein
VAARLIPVVAATIERRRSTNARGSNCGVCASGGGVISRGPVGAMNGSWALRRNHRHHEVSILIMEFGGAGR